MSAPELILANLTSPAILAFLLGVFAAWVRSDLRVPAAVHDGISIYLLLSIGLKGGFAVRGATLAELAGPALATLAVGIVTPLVSYMLARRLGGLSVIDAAALAAHYGSVSAVTVMAATSFAQLAEVPVERVFPALLALLEVPAILLALVIVRLSAPGYPGRLQHAVGEVLVGKTMLLLLGGVAIGMVVDANAKGPLDRVFVDPFTGMLVFFLLEMGALVGGRLREVRARFGFLLGFGLLVPLGSASLGLALGLAAGLSAGGAAMLATMAASASYIAAPAAVKLALPDADLGLCLAGAMGVTLPFNLVVGIPLYFEVARRVSSS